MTFSELNEITAPWSEALDSDLPPEIAALLSNSRSLFRLSWFDYDLLVNASLRALNALDAALHQLAYPQLSSRTSFRRLVDKAEEDRILTLELANVVRAGVEMRNLLSHPLAPVNFTPGIAAEFIEKAHQLVTVIWRSVRDGYWESH